jgi:hypothetical protein
MKKSVADKLSETLGIAQEIIESSPKDVVDVPEQQVVEIVEYTEPKVDVISDPESEYKTRIQELDSDIREVRNTLKFLVETGKSSIEELQMLATEAEEPRVYEVLGELIKSISDVSKELVLLHKTRSDILKMERETKVKKESDGIQTLSQTNVYVGNTSELIKLIRDSNNVNKMLPEQS